MADLIVSLHPAAPARATQGRSVLWPYVRRHTSYWPEPTRLIDL